MPTTGRPRGAAAAARPQRHRPAADDLHDAASRARAARARRTGPDELHVVILDNGRTNLRRGALRGDARLHPLRRLPQRLPGLPQDGRRAPTGRSTRGRWAPCSRRSSSGSSTRPSLPHASSLCGACTEACPVKIPLHELLLDLRRDLVERARRAVVASGSRSRSGRSPGRAPLGYRLTTRARPARAAARRRSPGRAARGRAGRALPRLAAGATGTRDERPRRALRAERGARRLPRPPRRGAADRGRGRLAALRTVSPTRAASSCSRSDEPRARSLLPSVHVTLLREDRILPGLEELFAAARRRAAERRSRSSPARAAAPTSSRRSPSACTGRARCTSSCCRPAQ